jgi:hypothetical protein
MPDGKIKNSPVLVADEDTERSTKLPKLLRNPGAVAFFRAMREMGVRYGVMFQPDIGEIAVNAVDQEKVRARFYELYNDGKSEPDAKKHAFSRALKDAQKAGFLGSRTKDGVTMIWTDFGAGDEQ